MKRKIKLAAYVALTVAASCALIAWAGIGIYNACEANPSLVPRLELAGQWFFASASVLLCGAVILAGWGAQAARLDEKSNGGAVPRRGSDVGTSPLLAVSESGDKA